MNTQRNIIDELKLQFLNGGMAMKLIFINVGVFLGLKILQVIFSLSTLDSVYEWIINNLFVLHTDFWGFLTRPWGIITSIFTHFDFIHLLSNLLFLYFFGKMFEQFFNAKRLLYVFVLGGILGGVLEIISGVFPVISPHTVIGASGGVMAILAAVATYRPTTKVHLFGVFPISIIWIAVFFFFKDFLSLGANNGIAHFAHLGGAVLGFLSVQNISSSSNIVNRAMRFGDGLEGMFSKNRSRMKVKRNPNVRYQTDEQYNENKKNNQEEIDRILDKISKAGYESLSKKEKDFLFRQSRK